jgi:sugar-specific transcriptional regulator TrmB
MDNINKLQQIGFSEYEAKTYLALLKENPATGYQISKNSGVPRSMVYEVLSRLHARGAVLETIEKRATYYRPLPPDILLDQYQNEIQNLISGLRPGLKECYENQQDNRVWSIVDRDAIFAYCIQMLQAAKNEVYILVNDNSLGFIKDSLEELAKKKIIPNILSTGSTKISCGNVVYHPPLESEIQGLTNTLLLLIDNKEVLVANISDESRATITENANLILIAKQFIWMEFFTQRVYSQIGDDLLSRLDPNDREIFKSLVHQK